MENASKALLIAAAVLIVIVLIGVSVAILNSTDTSSQVDSVTTTQETQAFNAQFTGYLGSSRAGNTIPNLLSIVNNSNKKNTQHDVAIICDTDNVITNAAKALPTSTNNVYAQIISLYTVDNTSNSKYDSNAKYSITATYDAYGYIYAITIK